MTFRFFLLLVVLAALLALDARNRGPERLDERLPGARLVTPFRNAPSGSLTAFLTERQARSRGE